MSKSESASARQVFAKLLELARGHRRHVVLVMVLAFLSTAADLANPLIYREAINDVAGLFIQQQVATQTPAVAPPPAGGEHALPNPGALPNRSVDETLNRLIIAVILLFTTSVLGYFFSLRSDYYGALVASRIESDLIVNTFRHVLRLPLDFFSKRPSAGLAKRINQSDEVAPIVHAFSQQIAPEAVRLVGICAIMLSQNWEMTLICMSMLPPYLWIARRSALRMRTGLEPYYEMWENISARIADAIGAIKTVKLSGAEEREQDRLARESTSAYGVYLNRIRTGHRFYISQSVLSHLSRSLVLGYGGYLVLRHKLTPGDVVMFISYLDRLYSPIDALNGLAVAL
jgi:ATP-binding cassette subfamily B protein